MANLTVRVGDDLSYSDGVYLPSDGVTELHNPIINVSVPFDTDSVVLRAVTDTRDGFLYTFPNDYELQGYNSSYVVTSDSDWASLVRERNITRVVLKPNYEDADRTATIIVKHNTEKEVYCEIVITQYGDVYELVASPTNIVFPINGQSLPVNVTCSGGSGEYVIHGIRKYTIFTYKDEEGEDDAVVTVTKRVNFDNALSATVDGGHNGRLIVSSNGSLVMDDSYYEIILEHKDMIGLTATIKATFETFNPITIPDIEDGESYACADEPNRPLPHISSQDEEETPEVIINERDTDIWIDSTDYCGEIIIDTIPQESKVYFIYYGNFIEDYIIEDYEDSIGNIYHGLKIKAKPNPYELDRHCVGYVVNAMYPSVKQRITIHQAANS